MAEYSRRRNPPSASRVFQGYYAANFLLGSYQHLYLGHSTDPQLRMRAASGGVGTALLDYLLAAQKVNGVVGVDKPASQGFRPRFTLIQDQEQLRDICGSTYVFMKWPELLGILKENTDRALALMVQPCYVPMLRKLQAERYKNIAYIISFFCGYNMDWDATDFILKKAGVKITDIQKIDYRGGPYPGGFTVVKNTGEEIGFGKEAYEVLNLMFLRKGCARCPFYLGEEADIALGDAWLKNHPHMNVVIARTEKGDRLLEAACRQQLVSLFTLQEQQLVMMHWGNLRYKKYGHGFFMRMMVLFLGKLVPRAWVPFKLLNLISKWRRKLRVGIALSGLTPVIPTPLNTHD